MSKLYFKYGAMGSSKTAQALMTRFNYIQTGYDVLLINPIIDTRDIVDGEVVVKSRIGIYATCKVFNKNTNLFDFIKETIVSFTFALLHKANLIISQSVLP